MFFLFLSNRIADCKLTEESCSYIGRALAHSRLRELDLSCNDLRDTGMKQLSVALRKSRCRLNVLKQVSNKIKKHAHWHTNKHPEGFSQIFTRLVLRSTNTARCFLEYITSYWNILSHLSFSRLVDCNLTTSSCPDVALVLQKANSSLRELDLSDNDLLDSGVKELSAGLMSSQCVLEILRWVFCQKKPNSFAWSIYTFIFTERFVLFNVEVDPESILRPDALFKADCS